MIGLSVRCCSSSTWLADVHHSLLQCSQKWCLDSGWWTIMSCSAIRAWGDRRVLCAACRSQWLYRLMTKESRLWISFVGSCSQCGYLLEDTDQLKLATGCHSLKNQPHWHSLAVIKFSHVLLYGWSCGLLGQDAAVCFLVGR